MLRKLGFFFTALLVLSACKHSDIRQSQNNREWVFESEEMKNFVDAIERHPSPPHSKLIVLDIDDNILTASGNLGTPPWFYTMVDIFRKNGVERSQAYEVMGVLDQQVQAHLQPRLIEHHMDQTIETWIKNGSIVVALTSRSPRMKEVTDKHLGAAGIRLHHPLFQCVKENWDEQKGRFDDGVMYVGHLFTKSDVFEHFHANLAACGKMVELIAHSDDQNKYVHEMRSLAGQLKRDFIGQIYKKAINERRFDLTKANQELRELVNLNKLNIIPLEYKHFFF